MLRFGKIKVAKEEFYATKKLIKIWNVNIDNIIISKLVEIVSMQVSSSKYLIGCLDEDIRPLVLMPKMSGYVKTIKDKFEIRIRIIN